ncbi:5'-nucleotidase, lipoprotein e(P4) family [Desulfogranum marinum]|uniref:5'-nucleotidase, lipoprotein e(P4) family n=1 Tax=Desulfogranum marinum TaxID=453220 RepID=UPI001965828B|nr:HAD family acid phosphatase [Desulfogranum marinum]MBM9510977.1 hypothetical protein [Desulfogranum marinum]
MPKSPRFSVHSSTPLMAVIFLKFIVIVGVVILSTGCSQRAASSSTALVHNSFNSVLWMQQSSNFHATSLQTYNTATNNLEKAVKDSAWTAIPGQVKQAASLPPAVVLDVDETVLDNTKYHAKIIVENAEYNSQTWDHWLSLQQATATPGAVSFINHATAAGVEIIYITNRTCKKRTGTKDKCPQKADTINNLKNVGIEGIKPANILLKNEQTGWLSEKESRKKLVAQKYRIMMLFGDDLGDFLPNVKKNITSEQRADLVTANEKKWGRVWYMLPNPKYGSWWNVLEEPKMKYLEGY